MATPYRKTFARLLGFLRPYRLSLIALRRARRRLAGGADRVLRRHGARDRQGDHGEGPPRALDADRAADRARDREGGTDGRPPLHLGEPGARRRVRHPRRVLRPPAAALVRVLRLAPDRPADVARHGRPAAGALLPRVRADLLLPAPADDRRGHRRDALDRLAARADRARDHAVPRGDRLPLQPRLASAAPRRAAEARRRRDRRRGEHRRRRGREGVRAGAAGGGEVHRPLGAALPAHDLGDPAAGALRADDVVPADGRPGGCAARRRHGGRARQPAAQPVHLVQLLRRDAGRAAAHARDVDRPVAARHRVGRADLRDHRRARGGRRPPGRSRPPGRRGQDRV